ncbi:MAG: hypothetical protein C0483_05945 [Pirellula sp.]|nr:hypothetical protein [Pirellula sp.]
MIDLFMAREESDREDLLREAVALVERVELRVAGETETVTAGYRRNGALSLFFGPDPVWQFNAAGELRRGYLAGKLLKAEGRRLVEMTRERTVESTQLVSRPLAAEVQQAVLQEASRRIGELHAALDAGQYDVVGQVPAEEDVTARVLASLATLSAGLAVAASPRVGA